MSAYQEKILFGAWILAGSALSWLGNVFTQGETRFVFATGVSSVFMAGFLSMMFKHPTKDTIQQVLGRFGISVMAGIFGTIPVLHYFGLEEKAEQNIHVLSGVSCVVCILFFILGVKVLQRLEKKGGIFADKIIRRYVPDDEEDEK